MKNKEKNALKNIKVEPEAFAEFMKCEGKIQMERGENITHTETILTLAKKFLEDE